MTMSPDPLALVGTLVAGKYQIERLVAEGGFSLVYRATHQGWGQPCVLKFLKGVDGVSAGEREHLIESLVREGALLRELSSRAASILQAHDVGTWVDARGRMFPYLVLEWLDGATLTDVFDAERAAGRPPLGLGETLVLFEPVAQALAAAHKRSIAHRDLKPDNLFLCGALRDPEALLKVLDFGVAKILDDVGVQADNGGQSSQAAFTPWYGAPEQFDRKPGATGPWTDVFALALILLEAMTFERSLDADDFMGLAVESMNPRKRPTPRHKGLAVSDETEAVFARAVAVRPELRYPNVGEFWSDLRRAAGGPMFDTASTASASLRAPGPVPPPATITGGPTPTSPSPPSMRNPPIAAPPSVRSAPSVRAPGAFAPTAVALEPPASGPLAGVGPGIGGIGSPSFVTGPTTAVSPGSPLPTGPSASLAPPARPAGPRWLHAVIAVAGLVIVGGVALLIGLDQGKKQAVQASTSASASAAPVVSVSAAPPAAPCPDGMVRIPGGEFYMGYDGDGSTPGEQPAHSVKLDAFCIDVTEVTVEAYRACSDDGRCPRAATTVSWPGVTAQQKKIYGPLCTIDDPGRDRHPINCVDWDMARTYCERFDKRLPTSAEWEFAVRGPDGRTFPWGDEPPSANRLNACGKECLDWGKRNGESANLEAMYNEDDGFPTTAPVGSFPRGRSRYGLDDVIGNVMEWVHDWDGPYTKASQTNPQGPASGTERVIRGGAWNAGQMFWVRPSFRFRFDPAARSHGIGFRCVSKPRP